MFTVPGCNIKNKIYESSASLVYRGTREADDLPVVLKILKEDYPAPEELIRYRQEYEITRNLDLSGVIKAYGQEKYANTLAIILEDFGGESLKSLQEQRPFSVAEVLQLAIRISGILGEVHGLHVIHKDLNPSNILYNPDSGQLKIIDFGISTKLSRELPVLKNPERLEGTLAYTSPEQTGRMNRALDYRTDFYALGATLYQLLTGSLPFTTQDPLELTHCHLAREPESPSRLNPEISKNLSQVILKLLAKRAEERYQTTRGLIEDLGFCLNELEHKNENVHFIPGAKDVSAIFQLPQKLYGREAELETLLVTAKRAAEGHSEALFVAGYSGVGKSALIKELYGTLLRPGAGNGYFISGKFDQYHHNIPYSAAQSAFRDLIRQLLTESEQRLFRWNKSIRDALGPNGRIMTEFLPELELMIGEQPPVPKLDADANRNRFTLELRKFVNVFLQGEHPLVLFLDDLQWADLASLELIKLMTADTRYLFLIGAYRDNEVQPGHPFFLAQDDMRKAKTPLNTVLLAPLTLPDIRHYIADATFRDLSDTNELADLVKQKTNGNPFFIGEFLKTMEREALLFFDDSRAGWAWDMPKVQEQDITDNVVELIGERVRGLEDDTKSALTKAACLGNTFDLATLALIHENSLTDTAEALWPALELNMLLPLRDEYKVAALEPLHIPLHGSQTPTRFIYKFAHDRVEEACYNLIPETERQALHLTVGRLLLGEMSGDAPSGKLFAIVDHLNMGRYLVEDQAERDTMAELNLRTGSRAQASTAYEAALNYYKTGLELLGGDGRNPWEREYELTLVLTHAAAEAALLYRDYDEMERLTEQILKRAKENTTKAKVYELRILAFAARNRPLEGIKTAIFALKMLGIKIPERPGKLQIMSGLLLTKARLAGKSPEFILSLPEMQDPTARATSRILDKVAATAYMNAPELLPIFTFQQIKLALRYGNTQETPLFYVMHGLILLNALGDVENAYKYGTMGLNLIDRLNCIESRAKVTFAFNFMIRHWVEPISDSANSLLDAHKIALENGDLETAAFAVSFSSLCSFFSGSELGDLEAKVNTRLQVTSKIGQKNAQNFLALTLQAIKQLRSETLNPTILEGEVYRESSMIPIHLEANDRSALFVLYLMKLIFSYHFRNPAPDIVHNALEAEKYIEAVPGTPFLSSFNLYDSLAHLTGFGDASKNQRKRILRKVKANQKKLKHWSHYAPMNHLHRYYLVAAELARVLEQDERARKFYELAVGKARENDFQNDEALAWELGGRFYLENNQNRFAQIYLKNALYAYKRWGADARVAHLEKSHPDIFGTESSAAEKTNPISTTNRTVSGSLDLAAIVKASQAIAGEIRTDVLIEKLMTVVLENTGAEVGFLILARGDRFYIEARAGESVELLDSLPLDAEINGLPLLPRSLMAYAIRTREPLVLEVASKHELFRDDPYIRRLHSQSVLCAPILHQKNLSGLLYLENNRIPGAFTAERLEVLHLLSAQIAVSLKNAVDYADLQKANRNQSLFLSRMSHELHTPLNSILGQGQMLLRNNAAHAEVLERAGDIVENGNKLNKFITNILELTRMERRGAEFLTNFSPVNFLERLTDPFQKSAQGLGLNFSIQFISNSLPREIRGDREQLEKLLGNLMDNAFKFTKTGGVSFRASYHEGILHCEVEDTGPGLTPHQQKQIFSPFQAAKENSLTTNEGAELTGLGLSVSKMLAENMGGTLSVRSKPAHGSVFIVEIPMEATVPATVNLTAPNATTPEAEPEKIPGPLPDEARILYKLASNGDVMGIIEYSEQLERRSPELTAFAREISRLAKGFQERKLTEFIGKYTD